jgi:hypothetical protein
MDGFSFTWQRNRVGPDEDTVLYEQWSGVGALVYGA